MAVYTEVSDQELTAFLEHYEIGALLSFKGIAEGVQNSNFLLHTDAGTFILTLFEKQVHAEDLPFFVGLMDHLSAKGINCPKPVHAKNGKALGTLAGSPALIVTFLDGLSLSDPREEHCEMLGEAMAKMHRAGEGFNIHRDNALALADWRPLYQKCGANVDNIHPGLSRLIEEELDFLEQNWPDQLPTGIIHADMFPDNVFFLGGRFSGLIDFYFSCNDILAYDVAIGINAWCFDTDNSYNPAKAARLLKGYQSVRKLSNKEIESFPVLVRGAAIRFLLTRVFDWINTPKTALVIPKNPKEYINKLNFYRTITNYDVYGIAEYAIYK